MATPQSEPLQWHRGGKYFLTSSDGGYTLAACRVMGGWKYPLHRGKHRIGIYGTPEEARAAAQADYEVQHGDGPR